MTKHLIEVDDRIHVKSVDPKGRPSRLLKWLHKMSEKMSKSDL